MTRRCEGVKASELELEFPSGSKKLAQGEQRRDRLLGVIGVVDVDAEGVATKIIVALEGNVAISGSPRLISGETGELDYVVRIEDLDP